MKKIILIIILLFAFGVKAQELKISTPFDFSKDNTFTGDNHFKRIFAEKAELDTLTIVDITNANATYWINGTDTLAYIDAGRSAIGFMRKLTVGTNFVSTDTAFIQFAKIEHLLGGSPIDVQDSLIAIDTNVTLGNATNYFGSIFGNNLYSKTLNVTTEAYFGSDTGIVRFFNQTYSGKDYINIVPQTDYRGNLGLYNQRWDTVNARVISFGTPYYTIFQGGTNLISTNSNFVCGTTNQRTLGLSDLAWKNTFTNSITLKIDSIGASNSDTIKVGKNTMIVNCDAVNNDTVFVANIGVSDGFEFSVIKVDAQATYVVVVPKGGYTIGDFATSDSFTGKTGRTYILKNKNFYIKP